MRRNTLRQKLPALAWYRGLPEQTGLPRWEAAAIVAVAAAAGVTVATSGKDLTGSPTVDLVWAMVVGAVVAIAGTRAPRPVLLGSGAVAAVGVTGWWSLAGVGALALASGLVYRRKGRIVGLRVMHAGSAALTLSALVHVPPMRGFPSGVGWAAASLAIAAPAVAAIVVSGWWNSPRRVRTISGALAAAGIVIVLGLGVSLWLVVSSAGIDQEVALVAEGTTLSTNDLAASLADLEAAGPGLNRLADRLDSPLWLPLRAVPLVAQQYGALEVVASTARDLVGLAGEGADLVNGPALRPTSGGVDLVAVQAVEAPLSDTVRELISADERLTGVNSPFLVPAIADAVTSLQRAAVEALPPTELALAGSQAVPGMLGANGPRTWLMQYVGTDGTQAQLAVADAGTITPLDQRIDPTLIASLGDLSSSPDYPAAASEGAARLAEAGLFVDGILALDESAARALAGAVGAPDGAASAAELITALGAAALPSPAELADAVGTAASERRLLVWASDSSEQAFLERIETAGSLRFNDGTIDLVYVGVSPQGGVRPEQLDRAITYWTDYDTGTGETSTRGELVISDRSNSGELVEVQLTLLSGLELESLQVAGVSRGATSTNINGWNRWTQVVRVPSGGSLQVAWRLMGSLPPDSYTFAFQPQVLVDPASLEWQFRWSLGDAQSDYAGILTRREQARPVTLSPRF